MNVYGTIVDFETTGLLKPGQPIDQQPGITQIGIMRVDENLNEIDRLHTYVDPEMVIEEAASKITGITNAILKEKGAQPFSSAVNSMFKYFMGSRNWIGYNIPFDKGVLWNQLMRYGYQMRFPWPINERDVMVMGKDVANIQGKSGVKFPKLSELHQFLFSEGFNGAHDAMADVCATQRCLKHMMDNELV